MTTAWERKWEAYRYQQYRAGPGQYTAWLAAEVAQDPEHDAIIAQTQSVYPWPADPGATLYRPRGARDPLDPVEPEEPWPDNQRYEAEFISENALGRGILGRHDIQYLGLAGFGEDGAIGKYRFRKAEGTWIPMAIKIALTDLGEERLKIEKSFLRVLAGSSHIVNEFLLGPETSDLPSDLELDQMYFGIHRPERLPLLPLEFMHRGVLLDWMVRANKIRTERPFSNKILWLIFDCLVQGVLDIAFPPRLGNDPNWPDDDRARNSYRANPNSRTFTNESLDIVHYDMDATNILVGNLHVAHQGAMMPPLKVSNFGVAEEMRDKKRRVAVWLRYTGKPDYGYLHPESFTEEWDHIYNYHLQPPAPILMPPGYIDYLDVLAPLNQAPPARVAGNWSYKSNLYQAGMIMWMIITGYEAPNPPRLVAYPPPISPHYKYPVYGYGFGLLGRVTIPRIKNTDRTLRELVAWCLCARPDDRPDCHQLKAVLRANVNNRGDDPGDETDNETRAWVTGFFNTPPDAVAETMLQVVTRLRAPTGTHVNPANFSRDFTIRTRRGGVR